MKGQNEDDVGGVHLEPKHGTVVPLFTIQCRTPPNAATPHPTNIP
jgi:hypothetical protein